VHYIDALATKIVSKVEHGQRIETATACKGQDRDSRGLHLGLQWSTLAKGAYSESKLLAV
jgi:hypothetical protein